jgi:hypothetical protein
MTPPGQTAEHIPGGVVLSQYVPDEHVVVPGTQAAMASLQVSAPLQVIASAQTRAPPPTHVPDIQRSEMVQYVRSSQAVPSAWFDQAVVETSGLQIWQPLVAFGA